MPPGLAAKGRGRGNGGGGQAPQKPAVPKETGPSNDALFDEWNGFEGVHPGGQTAIFSKPISQKESNNPINKEEIDADE